MADIGERKSKKMLRAVIPPHIRAIFGSPPVLWTEDCDAYDRLLSELALEVSPRGITEWLWVRDLADLNWEILRIRRASASVLRTSFKAALRETLMRVLPMPDGYFTATQLCEQWFATEMSANIAGQTKVLDTLSTYRLEPDSVVGQAFVLRYSELEKMERMLISAERRRDAVMRELQLHRQSASADKPSNQTIDATPTQLLAAE
jgi:hypothetical protein